MVRAISFALLAIASCSSLRGEGDPCNQDAACPWGQVCCDLRWENGKPAGGTCRESCANACDEADDCDDGNPCTTDNCELRSCSHASTVDADCYTDSGASGSCNEEDPPRCVVAPGQACREDLDCGVGYCGCTSSSCPGTFCTGADCSDCNYDTGSACAPTANGTSSPGCGPYACDGAGGCHESCTPTSGCAAGARCNANVCEDCRQSAGWCRVHFDPSARYHDIQSVSADEVWAVGHTNISGQATAAVFQVRNGTRYRMFRRENAGLSTLFAVWADNAEVWAVGEIDANALIVHGVGTTWTDSTLTKNTGLRAVWSRGAEVWVAGMDGDILRRTDPTWTIDRGGPGPVLAMWGNQTWIWAGGNNPEGNGQVLKRNSTWLNDGSFVGSLGSPVVALWGAGDSVWAADGTAFVHNDDGDGTWFSFSPLSAPLPVEFTDLWTDDAAAVWVLGTSDGEPHLFRWQSSVWSLIPVPWIANPVALTGSDGVLWVAGTHELLRFVP